MHFTLCFERRDNSHLQLLILRDQFPILHSHFKTALVSFSFQNILTKLVSDLTLKLLSPLAHMVQLPKVESLFKQVILPEFLHCLLNDPLPLLLQHLVN